MKMSNRIGEPGVDTLVTRFRRDRTLGLKNLFRRWGIYPAPAEHLAVKSRAEEDPLSPQREKDLQAAWAELTEAAKTSEVLNLHACTRNGRPWTTDPEAVRAIAAALREFPTAGGQPLP